MCGRPGKAVVMVVTLERWMATEVKEGVQCVRAKMAQQTQSTEEESDLLSGRPT